MFDSPLASAAFIPWLIVSYLIPLMLIVFWVERKTKAILQRRVGPSVSQGGPATFLSAIEKKAFPSGPFIRVLGLWLQATYPFFLLYYLPLYFQYSGTDLPFSAFWFWVLTIVLWGLDLLNRINLDPFATLQKTFYPLTAFFPAWISSGLVLLFYGKTFSGLTGSGAAYTTIDQPLFAGIAFLFQVPVLWCLLATRESSAAPIQIISRKKGYSESIENLQTFSFQATATVWAAFQVDYFFPHAKLGAGIFVDHLLSILKVVFVFWVWVVFRQFLPKLKHEQVMMIFWKRIFPAAILFSMLLAARGEWL